MLIESNNLNNISLIVLRNKIRFGQEPDNPTLIWFWLDQENIVSSKESSSYEGRRQYEAQFRLLLDTVMDDLVAPHWRRTCLDNIYKPLCSLKRLSDSPESEQHLQLLFNEMSIHCRYVEKSLNL